MGGGTPHAGRAAQSAGSRPGRACRLAALERRSPRGAAPAELARATVATRCARYVLRASNADDQQRLERLRRWPPSPRSFRPRRQAPATPGLAPRHRRRGRPQVYAATSGTFVRRCSTSTVSAASPYQGLLHRSGDRSPVRTTGGRIKRPPAAFRDRASATPPLGTRAILHPGATPHGPDRRCGEPRGDGHTDSWRSPRCR